jgi:hypothetical protein
MRERGEQPNWSREILGSSWHATRMTRFKVNGWILQAPNLGRVNQTSVGYLGWWWSLPRLLLINSFPEFRWIPWWRTNDSQNDDQWSHQVRAPRHATDPEPTTNSTHTAPSHNSRDDSEMRVAEFVRATHPQNVTEAAQPADGKPRAPSTRNGRAPHGRCITSTHPVPALQPRRLCLREQVPVAAISLDACAARVLAPGGGGSFVRFFSFFFIEISRSFAGDGRMGVPCKRRQNEANGRAEPPSCAVAVEKCRNPLAAKNNGQAETQREKKFSSSASPSSFCARAMYPTQSNPPSQSLPHEHHTRRPQ